MVERNLIPNWEEIDLPPVRAHVLVRHTKDVQHLVENSSLRTRDVAEINNDMSPHPHSGSEQVIPVRRNTGGGMRSEGGG